ncbi:MAG: hypothetical protein RLZZ214_1350 [Verrucomicrobiota bacterium]|jgi:hypothetical protein
MNPPTLAEFNAIIAQCGCCEHPRCCPPQLQCRSVNVIANRLGYVDPSDSDSDSDEVPQFMRVHYLKKTIGGNVTGFDYTTYATYPPAGAGGGDTYVQVSRVDSRFSKYIEEYDRAFRASAACIVTPDFVNSGSCEVGGSLTESYYTAYREDVTEGESIGANANFLSGTVVTQWVSAAGERTEEHIAWQEDAEQWDLDHPDYETEVADYEAAHAIWQADYDAWNAEWTIWNDEGQVGTEPTFDDPEPQLAAPREQEPSKFYPECTYRVNTTYTNWERVNLGEGWTIRLIPEEEGYENPRTDTYFAGSTPTAGGDAVYEDPVTYEDFLALVEAWSAANAAEAFARSELSESDSDYCPFVNDFCGAYKFFGDAPGQIYIGAFEARLFQYRWKLNKCCGFTSITSGWREVYWPLEYMQWLAEIEGLGSDDVIPPPPVDLDALAAKKQWLWSDIPPLCVQSDSADSDAPPVDPYDHETMWSPWSAIVEIPVGERGRKGLRNYFQNCYGPLKDFMPQVTGEVDFSDDLPDDFA